jgi:uncharacterized protein
MLIEHTHLTLVQPHHDVVGLGSSRDPPPTPRDTGRAMFQENVAVIQAYFAKQGEEDIRLRGLHPEVEWHVRSDFPDAGVYRGQDGFRQLKARFDDVLAEQQYQPLEFIDAGPDVVVPLRWTAQGRLSGAGSVESFEAWVFTVEGGLITTVVEFSTKEEALEAVGLQNQRPLEAD